ncbi:hypothetical protein ACFL59_01600 [Planctomycetota bacterium]
MSVSGSGSVHGPRVEADTQPVEEAPRDPEIETAAAPVSRASSGEAQAVLARLQQVKSELDDPWVADLVQSWGYPAETAEWAADHFNRENNLKDLATRLMGDGDMSADDVEELVTSAFDWKELRPFEKTALTEILSGHAAQFAPAARQALAAFLGVADPITPPPSTPELIDVGLPEVSGKSYVIHPDGFPVEKGGAQLSPPGLTGEGAERTYRAGQALVNAPKGVLQSVPAAVQQKLLDRASDQYDKALDVVLSSELSPTDANRVRSGHAATLLALYEGAATPEIKGQAANALLQLGVREPVEGLRANVYVNLEGKKADLSPAQLGKLDDLKQSVLPPKPPYGEWFPVGTETFEAVHYAHHECWEHSTDPVTRYKREGLTVAEEGTNAEGEKYWVMAGKLKSGGKEQQVRVRVIQSHDEFARDLDNPDVHAVFYTGHSNLGGNVSEAIRRGPEENGKKLLCFTICRGQQNVYEVANKYPNSHLMTSLQPAYFVNNMDLVLGTMKGVVRRDDYDAIERGTTLSRPYLEDDKENYIRPNELRRYEYTDLDRDGRPDRGLDIRDRFYNVTTKLPSAGETNLVPRAETRPAGDLDGAKIMNGVNFARTLVHYHVKKGFARNSALAHVKGDRIEADGWFDGSPTDDPIRVRESVGRDGKTVYNISVNKSLSDQSAYAIGALVQYEFTRHVAEKEDGNFSNDEKLRSLVMVGEYLAYMYCSVSESQEIAAAIGKRAGVTRVNKDNGRLRSRNLTYNVLSEAKEAGPGYATDDQVAYLRERIQF